MDEAAALPPLYHPPLSRQEIRRIHVVIINQGRTDTVWLNGQTRQVTLRVLCVCVAHLTPLPFLFHLCVCMYRRDCTSMLEHRSQKEMFLAIPRWRTQI